MKIAGVFFIASISWLGSAVAETNPGKAIRIVTPINHSFQLEINDLKPILENDEIKNRNVVVVSIAGALRQGKSFLLNFFIKYLYAQYKKHDISDWIGEKASNQELEGFKWRGGRKRETVGIWMWSEVFTHDYENGDKVAIILIDTQGIFDDQSSVRDCTTIFALSMMLSSVQCYNVMQNIREDDLQHLELFTEYGRLALEQSNEKPFQKLLFVVRDWPYAFETNYGWHGQQVIDEILAGNNQQTHEMRQMRKRLDSSFEDIGAFLMPHPGKSVAQGQNFSGHIQQIDSDFIKYAKELVPALFSPQKLTVKTINGQKVRARDLMQYLETYVKIFNGDSLPEPKTVLLATAEASNLILHKDLMNFYVDAMQKALNEVEYVSETELQGIHQKTKSEAIDQFQKKPKLGGDQLAATFRGKIEADIEEKFATFKKINEEKRKSFIEKADLHNAVLISEIKKAFEEKMLLEISTSMSTIIYSKVNNLFTEQQQAALHEFDAKKLGNDEVSKSHRDKLDREMNNFHAALVKVAEAYNKFVNSYAESMQRSIDDSKTPFDQGELIKIHQSTKSGVMTQFSGEASAGGNQMAIIFQQKIDRQLEEKFTSIEQANEKKRQQFIKSAGVHNENICREIKVTFENKVLKDIGTTYLTDDAFINLFIASKTAALDDFRARKMGDGEISNGVREKLERELDELQVSLKQRNEANKPPPPPPPQQEQGGRPKRNKDGLIIAGAQIGGSVGGPVGALVGGVLGKIFG